MNAKNSQKFPSEIRPIKSDFLHWIIFMTLSKPYSSESKFRCRRFDTFWRFLAFVLAKLPLKAELENGVTFLFLLTLELQKVGLCWSAIYILVTFFFGEYQNVTGTLFLALPRHFSTLMTPQKILDPPTKCSHWLKYQSSPGLLEFILGS